MTPSGINTEQLEVAKLAVNTYSTNKNKKK